MAESLINKNLADKRKEIQAYIGSLEAYMEQARRDLSAIIATERVFQSRGPKVTAYMELAALFPRHELPKLARAALEANPDGITAPQIASHAIAAKGLDVNDRHLKRSIGYKVVQIMRRWEKERKAVREKKVGKHSEKCADMPGYPRKGDSENCRHDGACPQHLWSVTPYIHLLFQVASDSLVR